MEGWSKEVPEQSFRPGHLLSLEENSRGVTKQIASPSFGETERPLRQITLGMLTCTFQTG